MTGLLLVGPPPAPAPAAPRAAQGVRSDAPGFADSLRDARTRPESNRTGRDVDSAGDDSGGLDDAIDAGTTTDATSTRTDGETTDDRIDDDRPDATTSNDEPDADATEATDANESAPAAPVAQASASDDALHGRGGSSEAGEARAETGARLTATLGALGGSTESGAGDAADTKTVTEGAALQPGLPAAGDGQTRDTTVAQQTQPGVAVGAGSAGDATTGSAGADVGQERSGDRAAAERVVRASDPAGVFEAARTEAKPEATTVTRESQMQPATELQKPSPNRLEPAAPTLKSAVAVSRGADAADDSAAMTAVQRGLGAAVRQSGGSVTIKLSPEALGQVRIEMQIRQGSVDVRFDATTEQARELLARHADMLRTTLQQKGFGVDRIDVHAQPSPTAGSRAGADASGDESSQRRGAEQDAAGRESRGSFGKQGDGRQDGQWREQDDAPATFEQWRMRVNATA